MARRAVVVANIRTTHLYRPQGVVGRWWIDLGKDFERNAKREAPVGGGIKPGPFTHWREPKAPWRRPPGALRDSIDVNVRRIGHKQLMSTLTIGVPYATYVVSGVRQDIEPRRNFNDDGSVPRFRIYAPGRARHIGNRPGKRGFGDSLFIYPTKVKGQKRNAFLDRAARLTAAQHPAVRGLASKTRIGVRR